MDRSFCRSALVGVSAVVLSGGLPLLMADAKPFSDWSAPVNLGPPVNTPFVDVGPAISKDGLSLYMMSNRPGGSGGLDLWVSRRATADASWGAPVNLGPTINTPAAEDGPALSRDSHWLLFRSDRPGGLGGSDIWASWRPHTHDDFAWEAPVNLGPGVNSPFNDSGPTFFEDGETGTPKLFFASDRPEGAGAADIYVSELAPDGIFGPAIRVPELSGPLADSHPSIRHDGLEIFLFSGAFGSEDLWVSTRPTVFDPWAAPTNLGAVVNTAFRDIQPYVSADRKHLFFASNRPGGHGLGDIYVTTRGTSTGKP